MSIPFIFLTARAERQQISEGKDLGAEDYLVKPVPPDDLLRAIRARLARSRELLLVQVQASYEASLTMLANAIEVRDEYTRGHVERVRNYSVVIARELRPEKMFVENIRFGAILHDIGKIHVRERVLRKRTALTEAEWAELKRHPETGAEMLKNIPYLEPAIPAVRHHHERWDGKGYPDGLAGYEIPLSGRIVAVADALDAMTTNRPYRMAMNAQLAYQELVDNAGRIYDPEVIKVLRKLWGEGKITVNMAV